MLEVDKGGTLEIPSDQAFSVVLYLVDEGGLKMSVCMTIITGVMPRHYNTKLFLKARTPWQSGSGVRVSMCHFFLIFWGRA